MNCTFKRIVSVLMSLVLLFGVAVLPGYATETEADSSEDYPMLTTQEFVSEVKAINNACEAVLGFRLFPEEKLQIKIDGFLNDVFAGIKEETAGAIDCELLIQNLPSLKGHSNEIKSLLKLDMGELDPALKEMADDYYSQQNMLGGFAISFIRVYLKTIESCEIYSVPVEGEEGRLELCLVLNFEQGESELFYTGIIYDTTDGTLNSREENGILGIGYVFDTDDYIISTAVNSWQRGFGFTMAYDIFCYVTKLFDYVTVRVKFTYDNREWMIQLWKGKYLVAPGAEIGIYNREIGSFGTFYNCAADEDMMVMGMEIYHQDDLIFEMEPQLHWWLTGFKLHPKVYAPSSLTMSATIDFPTEEMATLFVENANATGEIEAERSGTHTSFVW